MGRLLAEVSQPSPGVEPRGRVSAPRVDGLPRQAGDLFRVWEPFARFLICPLLLRSRTPTLHFDGRVREGLRLLPKQRVRHLTINPVPPLYSQHAFLELD